MGVSRRPKYASMLSAAILKASSAGTPANSRSANGRVFGQPHSDVRKVGGEHDVLDAQVVADVAFSFLASFGTTSPLHGRSPPAPPSPGSPHVRSSCIVSGGPRMDEIPCYGACRNLAALAAERRFGRRALA
jgi:hypothetical protein